ncbi:hypothetical protein GQ473_03850 [archaeon]|nr:hypothetical protein [archaeon]
MVKFRVSLLRYPEEIIVDANTPDEAKEIAKKEVSFSVWESNVQLVGE